MVLVLSCLLLAATVGGKAGPKRGPRSTGPFLCLGISIPHCNAYPTHSCSVTSHLSTR